MRLKSWRSQVNHNHLFRFCLSQWFGDAGSELRKRSVHLRRRFLRLAGKAEWQQDAEAE